jgi:predicted hotdog family 3-hydroxylacyl-ACP dehydratase
MYDIDIEKLIPHRDRLKLIDEILVADDKRAVTAATVNEIWPLYDEDSVSPIILIELAAQTTGIAVGNKRYKETGKGVYGWIVGIKQVKFSVGRISLGTRLVIRVDPAYDHESYAVFNGTVENASDQKILCSMEIQVFSPE